MVLSVLNYVAVFSFLVFMLFLAYVLIKYFKLRANSPRRVLHIKTAVIFATTTAQYHRNIRTTRLNDMGFCSRRYFFLSVCLLQMLSVVERQIFDFLGYLWIPILVNFFEIIFIILGFFGAYQYRPKYIISYILWHLFWLGWNIFIICLYLDVANLDHKTNKVLKLDSKSESWWSNQGPGCKRVLGESDKAASENCLVNYVHVEIFQAGLQCFTALLGIVIGICLSHIFLEEDDTFNYEDAKGPEYLSLHPMYVSSLDCLDHHFSKPPLNVKSTNTTVVPLNAPFYRKNSRKSKNNTYGDAIRYMQRSSSFDVLSKPNNKRSNRPKSMTPRSYLDSDLNF